MYSLKYPYGLAANLNAKNKIFILRTVGVLLGTLILWIAYLTSLMLFPNFWEGAAIVTGLLATSPIFIKSAFFIGGPIIIILFFSSFLFSIMELARDKTYGNLFLPTILTLIYTRIDLPTTIGLFLPLYLIAVLFFFYQKTSDTLFADIESKYRVTALIILVIVSIMIVRNVIIPSQSLALQHTGDLLLFGNFFSQMLRTSFTFPTSYNFNIAFFEGTLRILVPAIYVGFIIFLLHRAFSNLTLKNDSASIDDSYVFSATVIINHQRISSFSTDDLFSLIIFFTAGLLPFFMGMDVFSSGNNLESGNYLLPLLTLPVIGSIVFALNNLREIGLKLTFGVLIFAFFLMNLVFR